MTDFTPQIFQKLLETFLSNGYTIRTFEEYLSKPNGKVLILRHDVDAKPHKALEFAQFENSKGIQASYYFRAYEGNFEKEIIKNIIELGHEIGYHYEDLFQKSGNFKAAITSFEKHLEILRTFYPVKTICMDGHVFSRWNNHRLWDQYDYTSFGIIGEPYLDTDFNKVLYLTDTGRKWNALAFSLYDKVKSPFNYNYKSTSELIKDLDSGTLPEQIMITMHPQRWHSNKFLWLSELLSQSLKNPVKYLIIKFRHT